MNMKQDAPEPSELKHGDLIWPKTLDQFIPYTSEPFGDYTSDQEKWEREKTIFISSIENSDATTYEKILADWLKELDYDQFREDYIGEQQTQVLGTLGLPIPYVGHVGIISVQEGKPWVIEAVWEIGVQKIPYADWLIERSDADVWQYRLDHFNSSSIGKIVDCANDQLEKPYGFFNLNLNDSKSFYCSKLIWYSVFNTLGLALDDNPNPERFIWYSPKQLMGSKYLKEIHAPGTYSISNNE